MKNRFYVKKRTLLLIAGVVWLLAGFNVARMGILSYLMIDTKWYLFIFSMLVFSAFGAMFLKMSKKHTKRIIGYEDERPFWNFFDKKSLCDDGLYDEWRGWIKGCWYFSGYICCLFLFRAWMCISISRRFICKKLFVLLSVN